MRCPVCRNHALVPTTLEPQLSSHHCNHCGGDWLYLRDYLRWKERGHSPTPMDESEPPGFVEDSHVALLCPDSGGVMLKYRLGADSDRRVDLSPTVNGIWLDGGEWDLLKREGFAERLDLIFTEPWQRRRREAIASRNSEEALARRFGVAEYEELRRVLDWLSNHPLATEMLGYLVTRLRERGGRPAQTGSGTGPQCQS